MSGIVSAGGSAVFTGAFVDKGGGDYLLGYSVTIGGLGYLLPNNYEYVPNDYFPNETRANGPTVLDQYLNLCELVIAKVYNSLTGHEHWVLVTGKENGKYNILDPGYAQNISLDAYKNNFWAYVVVSK